MLYDLDTGDKKDWIVTEKAFDPENTGKYESIMCQGNGYMGIRAAVEEYYPKNRRYALVAGTFDKYGEKPTELPNFADMTAILITVNGQQLDLTKGSCQKYLRSLNLKTGLLRRSFEWTTPSGETVAFVFERFVSLDDRHLMASRVSVRPLNGDAVISIESGIDGRNRYGNLHFSEMEKLFYEEYIQYSEITNESQIPFVLSSQELFYSNDILVIKPESRLTMEPGYIAKALTKRVKRNDTLTFEKYSNVYTLRDRECEGKSLLQVKQLARMRLKKVSGSRFEQLLQRSAQAWLKIWKEKDVIISSENSFDQLALRFAVYHLTIMAPVHDNRMSIGAKGLSGKGYRGHTFWDTEIYILPFFVFTDPESARSLLEYRYYTLYGARKKAAQNGYEGAMYPWESAWITDSETSPSSAVMAAQEHHITADVAYGVYYYYSVTGDNDFMEKFGYEIIFETAKFWQSRVSYHKKCDRYEITGIVGPDEFTHDADNNTFTNYMAFLNMKLAVQYYKKLKSKLPALFGRLNSCLGLDRMYAHLVPVITKMYLPKENDKSLVPQDDTYLSLPEIDLTPYRTGQRKLRQDYKNNYSKLQVSKQADVMVLFILMEDLFSQEVKRRNFYYYEAHCVHESSLSLCSYSILAADIHERDQAYEFYQRACRIDLGAKKDSSNDGIHAASLGGIWQCTVFGFLGVRLYGSKLRIQPHLPKEWSCVATSIYWHGQKIFIKADHKTLRVNASDETIPVSFLINGKEIVFTGSTWLSY